MLLLGTVSLFSASGDCGRGAEDKLPHTGGDVGDKGKWDKAGRTLGDGDPGVPVSRAVVWASWHESRPSGPGQVGARGQGRVTLSNGWAVHTRLAPETPSTRSRADPGRQALGVCSEANQNLRQRTPPLQTLVSPSAAQKGWVRAWRDRVAGGREAKGAAAGSPAPSGRNSCLRGF